MQFTYQGSQIAGVTTSDLNGDPKPTAQQLADQVFSTFGKQLTNFKMTDSSQVKVAGQDGVRMLYTFTDKANTVTLGGYLLTYSTDQTVILFSGYAAKDQFDARVPTFDSVAGSFTPGATLDNTYTDPQNRFTFDYPDALGRAEAEFDRRRGPRRAVCRDAELQRRHREQRIADAPAVLRRERQDDHRPIGGLQVVQEDQRERH